MTVVGLFAGVGGLELGLERAGHSIELLCELMPEARAVLQAAQRGETPETAFRGAKIVADVTSVELEQSLPDRFDILAAGFPCQDLSQSGRMAGIHGSRSGLITHVLALLGRRTLHHRPRWIVLENVSNMRHLRGGEAMDVVLTGLSALGYSWAYRELDTLAFGLPQRRKRLFIVACKRDEGDPRQVLLDWDAPPGYSTPGAGWLDGRACGFYWTEGNTGIGWADDAIPTLKGGSGLGIPSPPAIVLPKHGSMILPDIRDAERLQGFPRGWTEAAVSAARRGAGIRWHLVGNAVSVPVAQWIGERLAAGTESTARGADSVISTGSKWPTAAWQIDPVGPRFTADVSDHPVALPRQSLLSLLDEEQIHRVPLSLRAATGFLSRFEASNLLRRRHAHRSAFLEILHQHVERPAAK